MSLETATLDHVPPSHAIHLALFRDVENSAFLHHQLLARNSAFEYAFIDASAVLSRLQLLSAVFKAVINCISGSLKTPNVHSETVLSLSSSSNITDAYRRFGISPSTRNLLVVKVTFPTQPNPSPPSGQQIWKHLQENVEGKAVLVTDENIASATDIRLVRKNYKLNSLPWLDAIKNEAMKREEMEKLIISAMASRGL